MPRLPKQLAISVLLLLAVTLIVLTARPKPFRTIRAAYPVTEWTLEVVEALKPA